MRKANKHLWTRQAYNPFPGITLYWCRGCKASSYSNRKRHKS